MSNIESFLKSPFYIFLKSSKFFSRSYLGRVSVLKRFTDSTSRGVVKSAGPRGQLTVQRLKQS